MLVRSNKRKLFDCGFIVLRFDIESGETVTGFRSDGTVRILFQRIQNLLFGDGGSKGVVRFGLRALAELNNREDNSDRDNDGNASPCNEFSVLDEPRLKRVAVSGNIIRDDFRLHNFLLLRHI